MKRIITIIAAAALLAAHAPAGVIEDVTAAKAQDAQPFINVLQVAANAADTETVTIAGVVFEFDTAADPGAITAGRTRVNINAAQTPTASIDALIAAKATITTLSNITFEKISANEMLIKAKTPQAPAVAETLAGSNNQWVAATCYGGSPEPRLLRRAAVLSRAAQAVEVTIGNIHFVFGFNPTSVTANVRTTAGVVKAWDGAITFSGNRVSLSNAGSTDWAATDVVTVVASN